MSNVDEDQLKTEIAKILEKANLATTSTKKVRQQLEKTLGCDLTEKRGLIDELVMNFVNSKDDDEGSGSEEEEEEKKPAKRQATKAAKKRKQSSEEEESEEESESEEEKKKPAKRPAAKARRRDSSEEASSSDSGSDRKTKKKGRKKAGSDSEWASAKGKKDKAKKARGKGSGYTRAYKLSPELAELMDADEMPRHEVVKRVWAIIKQKNLYDPNNKQFTICDDALYKVIGTKRFRTFGMMKYLKPHFCDS